VAVSVLLFRRFLCVANKAALVQILWAWKKGRPRPVHKLAQSNELLNKTKPKTRLSIFSGASRPQRAAPPSERTSRTQRTNRTHSLSKHRLWENKRSMWALHYGKVFKAN